MNPFNTMTSKVIPLAMKNVDTDMIIPAQHLTQINREGYGEFLFGRLKEYDKNFVFNKKEYADANILLTQSNFGCGSSREHAVWAIQQAGIKVIIAESFSDIFFNNSAKNGLLLITLRSDTIDSLLKTAEKNFVILTVNLEQQTVTNGTQVFKFDYDSFNKMCLINGYDEMDYLLSHREQISNYKTSAVKF